MSQKLATTEALALPTQEHTPLRRRASRVAGRLALAAICVIPAADYATSDVVAAKVYPAAQVVHDAPPLIERGIQDGLIAAGITAQSLLIGAGLSRNRKLQGAFQDFDSYVTERQQHMSKPRRALSKTINAPMTAIQKAGEAFERAGEKAEQSKSTHVQRLGRLAVDFGKANTMGPPMAILEETAAGNPPSLGRMTKLSGMLAGAWVGLAEGFQGLYHAVPATRAPLGALYEGFQAVTSVNLENPLASPVATTVVSSAAFSLAYFGYNVGKFHEEKLVVPTPPPQPQA